MSAPAVVQTVSFRVYGIPRPQGSKRAFVVKGRPILTESAADGLKTWRQKVGSTAAENRPEGGPIDAPVRLLAHFYLPAPKKLRWPWPAKMPDLSKLVRAVEDELSGVVITDDRLIVQTICSKWWATENTPPGAWISIQPMYGEVK